MPRKPFKFPRDTLAFFSHFGKACAWYIDKMEDGWSFKRLINNPEISNTQSTKKGFSKEAVPSIYCSNVYKVNSKNTNSPGSIPNL